MSAIGVSLVLEACGALGDHVLAGYAQAAAGVAGALYFRAEQRTVRKKRRYACGCRTSSFKPVHSLA